MNDKSVYVYFQNAFNTPKLKYHLLSIGAIEKQGYSVTAHNVKIVIQEFLNHICLIENRLWTSYTVDLAEASLLAFK